MEVNLMKCLFTNLRNPKNTPVMINIKIIAVAIVISRDNKCHKKNMFVMILSILLMNLIS